MRRMTRLSLAALTSLSISLAASLSHAQQGADYYKGKTVTYIVATAPGGGYDTYGRLVAEYMQKYLSGSTFVVKNMPGAGHLIGANAIYAAPADGLTIGTFNTGLIYNQLIGLDVVRFDLTRMSWIGKAASDPRVIVCAEHTAIRTFDDLRSAKGPVWFATAGVGSASYVETVMLTNALRLPAKVLTGYNGNQDQLAMRRGEADCVVASRSTFEQFVQHQFGHFIAQIGGNETDVPQLAPMVSDPDAKQLIALIRSQSDIVRFTAGPPGIPLDKARHDGSEGGAGRLVRGVQRRTFRRSRRIVREGPFSSPLSDRKEPRAGLRSMRKQSGKARPSLCEHIAKCRQALCFCSFA